MDAPRFCGACGGRLAPSGGTHPVCTSCGATAYRDPKVGVGAVVRDDAGRLLLVLRAIDPGRGRWALPAGFVDAGEDPRAAVAREVREETGLEVEVGDVVDVYPGAATAGGASFFLAFAARVVGGALAAGDDASDAAFFAPGELPDLAFASTLAAAEAVAAPAVSHVTLSTPDPAGLAAFYRRLLGWEPGAVEPDWHTLRPPRGGTGLAFQPEPDHAPPTWPTEPGAQQVQVHLDVRVTDLDAAVRHAVAAGATVAEHQPQDDVRVCLDPDGHPFCLWSQA